MAREIDTDWDLPPKRESIITRLTPKQRADMRLTCKYDVGDDIEYYSEDDLGNRRIESGIITEVDIVDAELFYIISTTYLRESNIFGPKVYQRREL